MQKRGRKFKRNTHRESKGREGAYPESCTSFNLCGTTALHHSHPSPLACFFITRFPPLEPPLDPLRVPTWINCDLMTVPSRSNAATREDAVGVRCTPCRQLRVVPRGVSHLKGPFSSVPSFPAPRLSKIGKTVMDTMTSESVKGDLP